MKSGPRGEFQAANKCFIASWLFQFSAGRCSFDSTCQEYFVDAALLQTPCWSEFQPKASRVTPPEVGTRTLGWGNHLYEQRLGEMTSNQHQLIFLITGLGSPIYCCILKGCLCLKVVVFGCFGVASLVRWMSMAVSPKRWLGS